MRSLQSKWYEEKCQESTFHGCQSFFFFIFFSTPIVKLRFNFHSPSARWFSFKYGSYLLDFWSAFPIMELYTVISSHRKCMIIIIMSILYSYTYSIVIFKFVRYYCNSRLKFEFKLSWQLLSLATTWFYFQ